MHINGVNVWPSPISVLAGVAKLLFCKILGFHGGDYEEWCLLGCYAVWLL
jgi:hypothetical protein